MSVSDLYWPGLTEERRDLARTAQDVLISEADDPAAGLTLGWFGIGIDEQLGGGGGEFADLAPVIEAAGARCAATAAPWTTGVVARLLDPARHAELLRGIAGGTAQVAIPVGDLSPRTLPPESAELGGNRAPASGGLLVHGAPRPTHLVLPLSDELVLVDTERVTHAPLPSVDASRFLHRVTFDAANVADAGFRLDVSPERLRVLIAQVGALDAAGAARSALEATLRHARAREQFGRPIGSFQAYKHRCANAYQKLKLAQSAAFRSAAEPHGPHRDRLALAAALVGIADCVHVCGEAVQLHGAIGFSWESGLHAYLRRARSAQIITGPGEAAVESLLALAGSG
jgi:alkylation response protein AidB-like acyl-CoA dehydrogenase